MPITFHSRSDKRLFIVTHRGMVSDDKFYSFYTAMFEDPRFDKSFDLLIDLRQAHSSIRSTAALRKLADFIREHYGTITGRLKVAVLAPEDTSFGFARMYEGLSSRMSWQFMVFRATNDALEWLGLPENLMDDIT